MKTFIKIFASIFGTFICVMLIVWFIRLSNNKTNFIGISALYTYFQSVDLAKPFNEMIVNFTAQVNAYKDSVMSFTSITDWNSFWSAIGSFMPALWSLLSIPIQALYYISYFIVVLISEIVRFFQFVITY